MEDYSLSLTISVNQHDEAIARILQRGLSFELVYYRESIFFITECSFVLTLNEAVQRALTYSKEEAWFLPLYVKCKDTYFDLRFTIDSSDSLTIILYNFGYKWEKSFAHNYRRIDFTRYIELARQLLESFKIIKCEVELY